MTLNLTQKTLYNLLLQYKEGLTYKELIRLTGMKHITLYDHLIKLIIAGVLKKQKRTTKKRGRKITHWVAIPDGGMTQ